ncbi:MAG: glycosyltransferase [Bacteroidales bacterium]|nr:glycosyltransferase [Bacteroidales bacterium]
MTKRVLIITYYWPPTGGSGVQRWVKFAKYLPQMGWQPVIYTPENPERLAVDESLLKEIPSCVEVLKTRIWEPYSLYRKLFRGGTEVNPVNSIKGGWKKRLAGWIRGNCFVPDPRVGWVKPSVRYLRKYLEEHPVDTIVTTGPPHSMHLIGRELHRQTGIRWIADFRDPWTEIFYFKHLTLSKRSERKHRCLEQSVLDEADAIVSVSPPVQDDFRKKTDTPVHLVTNGYDACDFPDTRDTSENRFFTVVHTGLFASDGNPLFLWDELARKCMKDPEFREKLRIRLIGKTDRQILDAVYDRRMGDNLENPGYLSHTETVRQQRSAGVLILPLRQEPEYGKVLPGKIFEYLAARRPVLGIGQKNGAAAWILKDCRAGEMLEWDDREGIRRFIEREWENFLSGKRERLTSDIQQYERRNLTKRLTEIL